MRGTKRVEGMYDDTVFVLALADNEGGVWREELFFSYGSKDSA